MCNSDVNSPAVPQRAQRRVTPGCFVASELERRGLKGILAGRDAEKMRQLGDRYPAFKTRVASVDDGRSLDQALADAPLVINCEGPFLDTAAPIVEAALRARIHYLDVSAEQRVALAAFERFSNAARAAGVLIIPAMAFFGVGGSPGYRGHGGLGCGGRRQTWP